MKIALGATLHKKVTKHSTGGTEIFVYFLAQELVKKGHQVSIFASGDSQVPGNLQPISSETEINQTEQGQRLFHGYQLLESQIITLNQNQFDIIHINYFELFLFAPFSKMITKPVIYTVHSDLFISSAWQKAIQSMVKNEDIFVFVSKNAHDKAAIIKNKTFIHNGIDVSIFPYSNSHQNYLLWLGRIRRKKGIKEAVEAAIVSQEKLIISGVIDNPEEEIFFEKEVKPLIKKNSNIELRGAASFEEKVKLYQGAKAFLFPINWEEPFGLTMIEAMACGTPVIAFDRGAVREIIKDGQTGFIVNNPKTMAEKVKRIDEINRENCRQQVENNFTLEKMTKSYLSLYQSLI